MAEQTTRKNRVYKAEYQAISLVDSAFGVPREKIESSRVVEERGRIQAGTATRVKTGYRAVY
jgi:hypothetical protein